MQIGVSTWFDGFKNPSSGTPPFSPSDIPNLAWWLDAADASTIMQTGGFVSQWSDKSTPPYHVTQPTGTSQPQTGITTVNGKNALTFDGLDDWMTTPTFAAIAAGANTVFAVNRAASIIGNKYLVAGMDALAQVWGLRTNATNTFYTNGGVASSSVAPSGMANIIFGRRNGTALDAGLGGAPLTTTTLAQNRNVPDGVRVGREDAGGGRNYFQGDMCEVLVYARMLTTDETNSIGQYLANKWGAAWTNV